MESIKNYEIRDQHGRVTARGSFSVVGDVQVSVDGGEGTPSADAVYENGVLVITLHDIKGGRGNGITKIDVDEQTGDEAVNTVTFKTDDDPEGTAFHVRNGRRGNGIADITEERSVEDGGTNAIIITFDDGTEKVVHTTNGHTGAQGATVHYDAASDIVLDTMTGDSEVMGMTQKAITNELNGLAANIAAVAELFDIIEVDEDGFYLVDENYYIGMALTNEGLIGKNNVGYK